tara:strand:- start:211 stop:423 length:213 start_codon:yes stop_codon:yes gene_type:complete
VACVVSFILDACHSFHHQSRRPTYGRLLVGLAALGTLAAGGGGAVTAVAAAPVANLRVAVLAAVVAGGAA